MAKPKKTSERTMIIMLMVFMSCCSPMSCSPLAYSSRGVMLPRVMRSLIEGIVAVVVGGVWCRVVMAIPVVELGFRLRVERRRWLKSGRRGVRPTMVVRCVAAVVSLRSLERHCVSLS